MIRTYKVRFGKDIIYTDIEHKSKSDVLENDESHIKYLIKEQLKKQIDKIEVEEIK